MQVDFSQREKNILDFRMYGVVQHLKLPLTVLDSYVGHTLIPESTICQEQQHNKYIINAKR